MKFARALKVAISRTADNILLAIAKLLMSRNIMKTVLLAACLLLIAGNIVRAASDEEESDSSSSSEEMIEIAYACGKEYGISQDEIDNAKSLNDLNAENAPCWALCILEERGVIKKGKIEEETVQEHLDKAKARMDTDKGANKLQEVVDECVGEYKEEAEKEDADECTLAWNLVTCVFGGLKE